MFLQAVLGFWLLSVLGGRGGGGGSHGGGGKHHGGQHGGGHHGGHHEGGHHGKPHGGHNGHQGSHSSSSSSSESSSDELSSSSSDSVSLSASSESAEPVQNVESIDEGSHSSSISSSESSSYESEKPCKKDESSSEDSGTASVEWTYIGTGDMKECGWDKIGTASSLAEAKDLMLKNEKCAKEGGVLFYSDYSYSLSWGVRCSAPEMLTQDCQNTDNPNWTQYKLSFEEEGVSFWSKEYWTNILTGIQDQIPEEFLNNPDSSSDELWFGGDEDKMPHGEDDNDMMIFGEYVDENGCRNGYTYCEGLSECLRSWEFEGDWNSECDVDSEDKSYSGFLGYFYDEEGSTREWVYPTIFALFLTSCLLIFCAFLKRAKLRKRQRTQIIINSANAGMRAEGEAGGRTSYTRGELPLPQNAVNDTRSGAVGETVM